jgi:bifunctional non-homologous end joining protein LigD
MFLVEQRPGTRGYALRIEVAGVLRTWEIPEGPSLNPASSRLAIEVDELPILESTRDLLAEEVDDGLVVWDEGTFRAPEGLDLAAALEDGELQLALQGRKLRGGFLLSRTRGKNWLLCKLRDRFATGREVTVYEPRPATTRHVASVIVRRADLLGETSRGRS